MVAEGTEPDGHRRGSVVLSLLVIIGLVVTAILVAALFDGSRSAASLDAGECVLAPESDQVLEVDTVPCSEPHQLEVIGTVTLAGDGYPGDQGAFRRALEACEPVFEDYVGTDYASSMWVLNVFTPTAEGWDKGERTATCLVFQFDEALDYASVTESARKSRK
jgi:hypothetical protein